MRKRCSSRSSAANAGITDLRSVIIQSVIGFVMVIALALYGAVRVDEVLPAPAGTDAVTGLTSLLFALAIGTIFIVVFLRFSKGRRFFGALYAVMMFVGIVTLADAFFSARVALGVTAAAFVVRYAFPRLLTHDLVLILGVAGAAMGIGLTTHWEALLLFMVALSVYDLIAVYKTKHMVTMFKRMASRGALFALVFPANWRQLITPVKQVTPLGRFYFLGSGDLLVPAMFSVAAFQVHPYVALGAALGALAGFVATQALFFSQEKKAPMAALPPIATGCIIGFLIPFLLWYQGVL